VVSSEAAGSASAPRLVKLLQNASVEVAAGSDRAVAALKDQFEPRTEVFIALLPDGDYRVVANTAALLRRAGYEPVPHIAARGLPNAAALDDYLARLAGEAAVERALIIAGDRPKVAGPFAASLDVIGSGSLQRHGVKTIGIAGHPEGHPAVDSATLESALVAKRDAAVAGGLGLFVVTQFCFEAGPVLAWLERTRKAGIDAPLQIGAAGPASIATLVKFGMRCGVGNSLRVLRNRPSAVGGLFGKAGPDELLADLSARLATKPDPRVERIHFFPFGGVTETGEFIARTQKRLQQGSALASRTAG